MCENQALEIVNRNPGCTPGFFRTEQQHKQLREMIRKGTIVRRYRGMMPCYYTPAQIKEKGMR